MGRAVGHGASTLGLSDLGGRVASESGLLGLRRNSSRSGNLVNARLCGDGVVNGSLGSSAGSLNFCHGAGGLDQCSDIDHGFSSSLTRLNGDPSGRSGTLSTLGNRDSGRKS